MLFEGVTFIKTWQFSQFALFNAYITTKKYERGHRAQEKSMGIIKDKFAGIITQYDRH